MGTQIKTQLVMLCVYGVDKQDMYEANPPTNTLSKRFMKMLLPLLQSKDHLHAGAHNQKRVLDMLWNALPGAYHRWLYSLGW